MAVPPHSPTCFEGGRGVRCVTANGGALLRFWFLSDVRYLHGQALTAYQHLGDQCGQVDALWGLGEVEHLIGEYGQARMHYTQALTLARELGHRCGEPTRFGAWARLSGKSASAAKPRSIGAVRGHGACVDRGDHAQDVGPVRRPGRGRRGSEP